MKVLDAGACGAICPTVNTREEAQKVVAWTTCAPRGTRSFGPVRATLYGGADYAANADKTIVRFVMIETAQALDKLDAILSVAGLQALVRRGRAESGAGHRPHHRTRLRARPVATVQPQARAAQSSCTSTRPPSIFAG
jgi:2-keto-3-deoxy-L-rhamnonate aldolase RhmA